MLAASGLLFWPHLHGITNKQAQVPTMGSGSKKFMGGYNAKCKSSLLSHPSLFPSLYKLQTNSGKVVLYFMFYVSSIQISTFYKSIYFILVLLLCLKHCFRAGRQDNCINGIFGSLIVPRAHEGDFGHAQKMSSIQVPNRYNTTGHPKSWTK